MKTVFWLIIIGIVLWLIFRDRSIDQGKISREDNSESLGQVKKDEFHLNLQVPQHIHYTPAWRMRPDEVFRKEYVSFTRISAYEKCPHMFELIYLYGFKDKSGRAAQVGNLVHKIIQLHTQHYKKSLSEELRRAGIIHSLMDFYDNAVSSMNLNYRIGQSELLPYLNNYVSLNENGNAYVHDTEHECNSIVGPYNLKCIIDRIDEDHRGIIVVDYKTGDPRNVSDQQLNMYAYALSLQNEAPHTVMFQFLKTGEIRNWRYTNAVHKASEEWMLDKIKRIESTTSFRKIRSRLCSYCGVSNDCQ